MNDRKLLNETGVTGGGVGGGGVSKGKGKEARDKVSSCQPFHSCLQVDIIYEFLG